MIPHKPKVFTDFSKLNFDVSKMLNDDSLASLWNNEDAYKMVKLHHPLYSVKEIERSLIQNYIYDYETFYKDSKNLYDVILKHPLLTSDDQQIAASQYQAFTSTRIKLFAFASTTSLISTVFARRSRLFKGNMNSQIAMTILFPGGLFLVAWNVNLILAKRNLLNSDLFKKYKAIKTINES